MRPTSASVEWIFLATYLVLEILSAACDQASSPRRPHFALFGMLLAIAAVFISIGELIYRGKRERVVLRRRGMLWWFYHPPPPRHTPFGTLPDIYGQVAGISQCICSIVQYVYCLRHADSPLKASLLPVIFLFCLVGARLLNNRMNASTEEPLLNPDLENNAPANTPSLDNQEVEEQEQERQLRRRLPREPEPQLRRRLPRVQERRLQQRERLWQLQEQEQEQKQEQERQVREQEQEQLRLQLQELQEQEQEQERQVLEQEQERLLLRLRQLQEQEEEQQQRQRRQRQLQEQGQEQLQLRLQKQKWWSGES